VVVVVVGDPPVPFASGPPRHPPCTGAGPPIIPDRDHDDDHDHEIGDAW